MYAIIAELSLDVDCSTCIVLGYMSNVLVPAYFRCVAILRETNGCKIFFYYYTCRQVHYNVSGHKNKIGV